MTSIPRTISVCLLWFVFAAIAFAQGGVATGDLHITVKDPKGDLVNNANVMIRNSAKGIERAATSDGEGGYNARLLPPGTYTVTVEARGFAKVENTGVTITVGELADLPVNLSLAMGTEVVTVSTEAELVETSQSSTTDTIGQRRIDNLPINGRDYIKFTLTDSQVVHDAAPNLGAAPTSGLNMSGQRARSNLVNVDGTDATDNSVNGVRSTVSQEAVQEFQIITNSYGAEYGRASGGVVNIITRSGSNDFHGDVYGYLRNRNFQAVNPFSTVPNPAYTRVQAGAAFGGAIKKDKTFYYFSYEITRRHETGFASIGQDCTQTGGQVCFGLTPFDASGFFTGAPKGFVTLQLTPEQIGFLNNPAVQFTAATNAAYQGEVDQYIGLVGSASGMALNRQWPIGLTRGVPGVAAFALTCNPATTPCFVPGSFQSLSSQTGNFPVFEGTSLYSFRLDHNLTNANRLMLRVNVSPSTVTGIEVSGQDQPFGQNAYSRTSEQTYRDVAGTAQDTWSIGTTKINELRFQYARRGLSFFYNTQIPSGQDPAVNIPGFGYFGHEPYSYIQRTETRYQVSDNFSWSIGRHNTKFGVDFNYLPLNAIFTVNYGGVYDIGSTPASTVAAFFPTPAGLPVFPGLSPVQSYGAGLPGDLIQGVGNPRDSFNNIPIGVFWQDSWRMNRNLTLNYGVRYDVEIPPTFKPISALAQAGYNLLGLQKGIQTDKNNVQPRVGLAWDPKGNGKTVIRSSYGLFYDHPLLALYFLGDASDASSSVQLAFGPGTPCSSPGNPGNLNAFTIFQGVSLSPANTANQNPNCFATGSAATAAALDYSQNQQRFSCGASGTSCGVVPNSVFINQGYLQPSTFLPLRFQPFGYPQAKNFVYAYSQQANFSIERDLGSGFALSLAYNFNGGRHLNRPINAHAVRGDLMVANFNAALAAGQSPASPFTVSGCGFTSTGTPYVDSSLMNFFRPGGINPSMAGFYANIAPACVSIAQGIEQSLASQGFNANCPTTPSSCVPFGDMDANFSNGSSVYHGLSANLRKRFSNHYEFLASYTWSHAIDDSTDLQATLTPQDSYFPGADRSSSLFDQRHRFVFSGVYQTGKLHGNAFTSKVFSDWTFAPLIEFASGRPFNIITGNEDNLQLSGLTGRPNTTVDPACGTVYKSKFSPTGTLQEPCFLSFLPSATNPTGTSPTLQQLDGNLGRNAGITPWTVFDDLRISKRISFRERFGLDLIADMFNIANKMNVAAVSPLFTNAGQATAAYDPRQFQFAMKFSW
ncbi:MAG TPA: carboxypeptidase regulatory-like domain-containing protein [Candidatus Sulfotelmatobacter sp.]|nr:carboxypeptidase regulatory-like domain-containing protein [Candidatus Sulfotelmatobacter sp.]